MPPLMIPPPTPLSAGPKSAAALDFESSTWQDAVNSFRMLDHKEKRVEEFLKAYSTPLAVAQTLRERQREAPNQYSPVLSKILGKIDIFLAAGDIAVKGAPESVGLAWTGISLALGSIQDDFATFQLFSGACVDIIGIMVSCRLFGRMFTTSKGPEEYLEIQDVVRASIPKVYGKILEFSYQMFKYMDRSRFLRITRGILKNNKEEFAGAMKGIKEGERLLAENATKASQALTSFWQQKSDDNQSLMLDELKQIQDKLNESTAASKELNDYLKKELEEQRRKTPIDVARETYSKHKQSLRAVVDTEAMLLKRTDTREEGTCNWIFETDAYKKWHESAKSDLLWVSGGGNMGKSVLVSSVIEKLREETIPSSEEYAFFFFCKSGDDNAQKTDRIMDHLLYHLYDLVPMTLESLDRCNDIVRQYLAGRTEGRSKKRGQQQDTSETERTLYFEDAFPRMAEVLKKKIYLVVDALDECSDRKDEELIQRLATLTKREGLKVKILLTSRPEPDIAEAMDKSEIPEVRMASFNEGDILRSVENQLKRIPGMTSTERTIARDKICKHAGPYFGYLNPALELLRRPWQRPIEVHLEQLPENLQNMNNRIFSNTDPSYIGFLKTCLTWVILANGEQKMKISELIDIYSNRFLVKHSATDGEATIPEELTDDVTKFYKQMIRTAGDSFLDLDEKSKELNLIKPALVKDSFLKTNEEVEQQRQRDTSPDECDCKNCQTMKKQQSRFVLTKKHGHLEIALQIFKHLNSPLFQKMYLQLDDDIELSGTLVDLLNQQEASQENEDSEESKNNTEQSNDQENIIVDPDVNTGDQNAESNGNTTLSAGPNHNDEIPQPTDVDTLAEPLTLEDTGAADTQQTIHATPSEASDREEGVKSSLAIVTDDTGSTNVGDAPNGGDNNLDIHSSPTAQPPNDKAPSEDTTDDAAEVASNADSDISNEEFQPRYTGTSEAQHVFPRYEISQAMYHLQMVEEEWLLEERRPQQYEDLYEDVVKFFDPSSSAFRAWKNYEVNRPGGPLEGRDVQLTPLHFSASCGLVELSRRLIEEKQQDVNGRKSDGAAPLSWACRLQDNAKRYRICELLLKKGALPSNDGLRLPGGDLAYLEPPFHSLLYYGEADTRLVQLFLDHDAKVDEIDPWGFNVMHNYAWSGKDPAVLDLLVSAGGNVNIEDKSGERPLHKLLNSRGEDLPLDVLKRFLHHNADISCSDKYDQQPLFEVAEGGSVEALQLILDRHPDIDHVDEQKWTALHNAARWGNLESCKLLYKASADPTKLDSSDRTPFYLSCFADNVQCTDFLAQLLIERDNRLLSKPNTNGKTMLRKATALEKTEMVRLLLTKYLEYMNIDAADNILNWSPLHIAAYQGSADIVELLLDHGADPKCKDKRGRTALVLSYQQWELLPTSDSARDTSFEGCLVALIDADRDAAVAERHLLSAAARKGSIPVLEALVLGPPGQPRADPVLRDEYGWTAIELAKQYKRQLAVDFLQQHSGLTGRYPGVWVITKPEWTSWDPELRELQYTKELEEGTPDWNERVTVFADIPIPASLDRYYFEVSIEFPDPAKAAEEKHAVGVGVFSLGASKWSKGSGLEWSFPGHFESSKRGTQSWGYHGDDGLVVNSSLGYNDDLQLESLTYGHGDTVGCGIDFNKGYVFWTKNGERLMNRAFEDIQGRLTPAIGLTRKVKIQTAFSGPFKWKYGDTLDFDADIPATLRKQEPLPASSPAIEIDANDLLLKPDGSDST